MKVVDGTDDGEMGEGDRVAFPKRNETKEGELSRREVGIRREVTKREGKRGGE